MKFRCIPLVVISLLVCRASARLCPEADISGDCKVDWQDVAGFAVQWLGPGSCSGPSCADFDRVSGIDSADFAFLADSWRQAGVTLAINEFMASNSSDSNIADPQGEHDDWIEIYNYGEVSINVGGLYLTDDLDEPNKWRIPTGYPTQTTIPAGGYLIFWADEDTQDGPLHAGFKLSQAGEDVGLYDSDGYGQIDAITFGEQFTNISYGRYPDASDNLRFFSTPTPAADNNGAYIGLVEAPEFSRERGFITSDVNIIIACVTSGAQIYYTTDGREPVLGESPGPTSQLYTSPIHISSTACLRAAAIKTGWMPSRTITQTYFRSPAPSFKSIPVLSLVGDPNTTFYEPDGVMAIVGGYYDGEVWQPSGPDSYNNPMQDGLERPVSAEYLLPDGNEGFQNDCGLQVHGSTHSRPRYRRDGQWYQSWVYKISLRLYFRNDYGQDHLDYSIFPDSPIDRWEAMVLRAGKNDPYNPFLRDEWARRLHRDMETAPAAGGTFVNLFINGVYKGYYNPTERIHNRFFQQWYDSSIDWDVVESDGVKDGDNIAWSALVNFAKSNDLSANAKYQYVAGQFDVTAFVDYLILQLYLGNWDWPANNWSVAAERSDARIFRYAVWDAEGIVDSWALGTDWSRTGFTDFPVWWGEGAGLNNLPDDMSVMYRALKANADFRQLFADRIHKHFRNSGTLTKPHLNDRFWEMANQLSQVIPGLDQTIPNSFIPQREDKILAAFDSNGLYDTDYNAPVFNINGSYKHGGYISAGDTLTITNTNPVGTIYYTLDGNDPRQPPTPATTITLVPESAAKKVLVPASNIGTTWQGGSEPYNDSGWNSGAYVPGKTGGVGYDRDATYLPYITYNVRTPMDSINGTCYIRIPFNISLSDINTFEVLTLRVRYDDGFVAYINGYEVKRVNAPSSPQWNSTATAGHDDAQAITLQFFDISSHINKLRTGANILAIHGLNYGIASSDFLLSADLTITDSGLSGGVISPTAIQYAGPVTLNNSAVASARILRDVNQWSPLNRATYAVSSVANAMRITEVMYHPPDTNDPNDPNTEYIELKNVSGSAVNLNLVHFSKGIDFTFPSASLPAGQHILVVKSRSAFEAKYGTGRNIAGEYSGSLENAGERIRLEDGLAGTILDFEYKDGWRDITDGGGYSLTIINPANADVNSWGKKDSWRASAYVDGSPGWDDSGIVPNPGGIVINEVMAHSHANAPDWIELYNTTGSIINIGNWFLSDDDSNVMKYRFASGTTIGAYGYLIVYEDVNFGPLAADPGKLIPFALSENGDMVCVSSGLDANGLLTGYRSVEDFGASETGVSFGRYYKASTGTYNFVAMDHNTPRAANAYPKIGAIIVTEIMYHPDWPANSPYGNDEYEYVELRNISGSPVTLYDTIENESWKFTDGIDYIFSKSVPVTILAGARIVVVKNPATFSWRYPSVPSGIIYGPYDGRLANEGEKLELGMPGDVDEAGQRQYIRVERVDYSDGSHPGDEPGDTDPWPTQADGQGKSLTRISTTAYANDPNNFSAAAPSPGT